MFKWKFNIHFTFSVFFFTPHRHWLKLTFRQVFFQWSEQKKNFKFNMWKKNVQHEIHVIYLWKLSSFGHENVKCHTNAIWNSLNTNKWIIAIEYVCKWFMRKTCCLHWNRFAVAYLRFIYRFSLQNSMKAISIAPHDKEL